MRKAFISYSSQDAAFAGQLASELQRSGIGVWFDQWEIRAGDSLIAKISEGLNTHDLLLVVLSPASVASAWVQKELNTALITELDERKVAVIPALYRDCKIPAFLKEKKYADFRSSFAKGFMEVRLAIAPELFADRQKRFTGEIVGIDFGTSNSLISVMENGVPRILTNLEGSKSTPSVSALTPEGEWIAGLAAVAQSESNPQRTFYSIKSRLGTDFSVSLDRKAYRAADIAAVIFRKLKQDAEANLGRTIRTAVLTCPARFSQRQRIELRSAALKAGFEVLRLVSEPTAALLAYGFHRDLSLTEETYAVAVYDMGGGSFDISIAEPGDGIVEVKSAWGDTHLGGDDFDARLYHHCAERFQQVHSIDLREDAIAAQRLSRAVEAAKVILSGASSARILIRFIALSKSGASLDLDVTITRAEFESMTRDLVERSIASCRRALVDLTMPPALREYYRRIRSDEDMRSLRPDLWAALQPGGESDPDRSDPEKGRRRVQEVILCGLSTKMPAIRSAVREAFGRVPICRVDPDEAVALGAAVQAAVLEGLERESLLLDTIPISLGIELKDGSFLPILHRQETFPVRSVMKCSAELGEDSTLVLKLYEGESAVCSENQFLCSIQTPVSMQPTSVADYYVRIDVDANVNVELQILDGLGGLIAKFAINSEIERAIPEDEVSSNVIGGRRQERE